MAARKGSGGQSRESYKRQVITAPHIRAAGALLGWSAKDLAQRAGLALSTAQRAEAVPEVPKISARSLAKIEQAFYQAGVMFLEVRDTRGGGRGVRFIERE